MSSRSAVRTWRIPGSARRRAVVEEVLADGSLADACNTIDDDNLAAVLGSQVGLLQSAELIDPPMKLDRRGACGKVCVGSFDGIYSSSSQSIGGLSSMRIGCGDFDHRLLGDVREWIGLLTVDACIDAG